MAALRLPLVEGSPVWGPVRAPAQGPLRGRHRADVVVVGAGAVGLGLALALHDQGLEPLVLEARHIGAGSTPASTALLLWETDADLRDLAARMGADAAARTWRAGHATLDWMTACAQRWGLGCWRRAESVYFPERVEGPDLVAEAEARREAGLPSRHVASAEPWLGFETRGAIVSEGAATVNPVHLLEELARACARRGIRVHQGSPARRVRADLVEGPGFEARGGRVVVAAGLRALEDFGLPPLVRQRMTYVVALEGEPAGWREDVVAWSHERPYHYLRREGDLTLVGGGDLRPEDAARAGDAPYRALRAQAARWWPALRGARVRGAWAGLFPNTPDGLPIVGPVPGLGGADAVLAFGGNGLVFGFLGAWLVARAYAGEDVREELAPYAVDRAALRAEPRQA